MLMLSRIYVINFGFIEGEIEGSKVSLKSYRDINVSAYCPTVTNGTGKFIVADTDKMLPRYSKLLQYTCSTTEILKKLANIF